MLWNGSGRRIWRKNERDSTYEWLLTYILRYHKLMYCIEGHVSLLCHYQNLVMIRPKIFHTLLVAVERVDDKKTK